MISIRKLFFFLIENVQQGLDWINQAISRLITIPELDLATELEPEIAQLVTL